MNKKNQSGWFDVDRTGLEKILARRGIEFAVFELIQNAWDEAGVTRVDVTLQADGVRGTAALIVTDNAPEGFKDLRHAYTLFAESEKKKNAEQRGRFNIGEKLVLSRCKWAEITTTTGTVLFSERGRVVKNAHKRAFGTEFRAVIRMSGAEIEQVESEVQKLIPPHAIKTTFNGVEIANRDAEHQLDNVSLLTEIADAEGVLRHVTRKTSVRCHVPREGEQAMIYEMGIPVVEHDCAFHCDVQQKVPLTLDRENVRPFFVRELHTLVFNATHEELSTEEMNNEWAQTAIESDDVTAEAVADYMTKRFGEKRASWDPSDLEANARAAAEGYTLVKGGMMSGAMWANVKEHEQIESAGKLFPTHSDEFVAYERAQETDGMKEVRSYADALAMMLLECSITVEFGEQASREQACWGHRRLQFNVRNLGVQWFNLKKNRLAVDDLIIHEFAHHYETNHLSERYYNALSRLAAKAMQLGREGRLP